MRSALKIFLLAILIVLPAALKAQPFQRFFDIDHTFDWGWDIALLPSGNYLIDGWNNYDTTSYNGLLTMEVSADGNTVLHKNVFKYLPGIAPGRLTGQLRMLPGGKFLMPLAEVYFDTPGYVRGCAGLAKLDTNGDTVFTRNYTDTATQFDNVYTNVVLPDGDYLIGGLRAKSADSIYPGLIIRTDSNGNELWAHTYQKDPSQWVTIISLEPLAGNQILVGAESTYELFTSASFGVLYNEPWFMIVDSSGTIVKDTIYTAGRYLAGGGAFPDFSTGYVTSGIIDSLVTEDPSDYINFPCYIGHLDTNFRFTWVTDFPYSDYFGQREIWTIKKLRDSSYLIVGDVNFNTTPNVEAWAAKVDRSGNILWNQNYVSDSDQNAYFRDAVELPDGELVFVGASYNDTLPKWHTRQDVWLVRTDSNGCMMPGCSPDTTLPATAVPNLTAATTSFTISPNPTTGTCTCTAHAPGAGTLKLYNMTGQQIAVYTIGQGNTDIHFPVDLPAGIYMGVFNGSDGHRHITRIVYEP